MRRVLIFLLCFLAAGPSVAAEKQPVALTPALRQTLENLPHLYGRKVAEAGLEGRVVLVSFFASWCPPCHTEFQHLRDAYAAYHKDGLRIVAVNYFEDLGGFSDGGVGLDRFLERHTPWHSVVMGNDSVSKLFADVTRIPTVFIFDRQGRLALHFIHRWKSVRTNLTMDELHAALRPLLGLSPSSAPTSRSGH
ncbi:MAG: TlpA disulfide reductase family protein [Proteobacteria bacterium]|nr:TlpA disulfide reductase family protein [Pseudomonadota bacterium]